MAATPTDIPVVDCTTCGHRHPDTRRHCPDCGRASLFGHEACTSPAWTEPDLFEVCS